MKKAKQMLLCFVHFSFSQYNLYTIHTVKDFFYISSYYLLFRFIISLFYDIINVVSTKSNMLKGATQNP